jgi:GT2 family glycosyltransferase
MHNNRPADQPSVSIVVVSYNTAAHIETCLLSLLEQDYPRLEVIVVDNASADGSVDLIRSRFPDVEPVSLPDNKGFAGGASVGLYMASGEIVATVNPDVRLDRSWVSVMVSTLLQDSDIGVAGSKILYPDGKTIQHAGGVVHHPLATTDHIGRGERDRGQYDRPAEVSFVTGAALAMWREVGAALRFFDESYYPLYYEDVDLCWRASKEGLKVIYQPEAVAYHKESVTMDRESGLYYSYYHANRLRFVTRHYSPEQVMIEFLPAEAMRIVGDMAPGDRRASLRLLDNLIANGSNPPDNSPAERRLGTMQGHVDEVMRGWRVRERPFRSSTPVLGKLIVSLRERLNNLSTRWYVQPIMQQQVDYNASVARTLREMSVQLAELQARVQLQGILTAGLISGRTSAVTPEEMTAEIEALRARLDQLELDLARSS